METDADDIAWYHTFDLPGGVTTPGWYDLRQVVGRLPIPTSLAGKRCLDAASADGFFAFELARRGAAEVVSVDLDDPGRRDWQGPPDAARDHSGDAGRARRAFGHVRAATGLDVARLDQSVYDLSPSTVGTFDYVFMGNVLLHLQDTQGALRAIRSVTAPDGEFLSFEAVSLALTVLLPHRAAGRFWDGPGETSRWWTPNLRAHRRMVRAAGFEVLDHGGILLVPFGPGRPRRARVPRTLRELGNVVFHERLGVPSAWVRARPRYGTAA